MLSRPTPTHNHVSLDLYLCAAFVDGLRFPRNGPGEEREVSIRNLDKIFEPHRVAVIGASDTPSSVGYTVLRNLVGSGFRGVVYPVNPKRESVQGIQAYKDIPSLPHAPDLAIICTPAPTVPLIVRQCGEAGTRGLVIISAGFREVGTDGKKLEELVQ